MSDVAPANFAIIAPRAEEPWLTDFVVSRQAPIHLASLIGIVALLVIAWVLLSEESPSSRAISRK